MQVFHDSTNRMTVQSKEKSSWLKVESTSDLKSHLDTKTVARSEKREGGTENGAGYRRGRLSLSSSVVEALRSVASRILSAQQVNALEPPSPKERRA